MSSIKIKTQRLSDEWVELRILLQHPMENGRNREPLTGELIPARFIENLTITLNNELLISAELGGSISKNPFFSFHLHTLHNGDRISVRWQDNLANSADEEYIFAD